jgi:hypothetical protein
VLPAQARDCQISLIRLYGYGSRQADEYPGKPGVSSPIPLFRQARWLGGLGTVSRIAPTLSGPVTTPRNDVQIVVTEYSFADLTGKSLRERAEALVGLAHPEFRESLVRAALD